MKFPVLLLIAGSAGLLTGCGVLPVHPAFCPGTYYYGPRPIVAPFLPQPGAWNQCGPGPFAMQPPAQTWQQPPAYAPYAAARPSAVLQAGYRQPRVPHRAIHAQHTDVAAVADGGCQCRACRERRLRLRHAAHGHRVSHSLVSGADCCACCDACSDGIVNDGYPMEFDGYDQSAMISDSSSFNGSMSSGCPCQSGSGMQLSPAGQQLQMSPPTMEFEAQDAVPMPEEHQSTPEDAADSMPPVTYLGTPSTSAIQPTSYEYTESLIIPEADSANPAMKASEPIAIQPRVTIPSTRVLSRRVE
ncbi:MAG: hypothetical protein R3C49_25995 [Planctomycetaceae bacterium]